MKDVPPDVHAILRRRAAAAGRSLQEYLLARLVEDAHTPTTRDERCARGGAAAGEPQLFRPARRSRRPAVGDRRASSAQPRLTPGTARAESLEARQRRTPSLIPSRPGSGRSTSRLTVEGSAGWSATALESDAAGGRDLEQGEGVEDGATRCRQVGLCGDRRCDLTPPQHAPDITLRSTTPGRLRSSPSPHQRPDRQPTAVRALPPRPRSRAVRRRLDCRRAVASDVLGGRHGRVEKRRAVHRDETVRST